MTSFSDLGVRSRTLTTLANHKLESPLPVQSQAIPALLQGRDCVMQAPTGSGKTLAFLVPLVERLAGPRRGAPPRALIIAPTRELVAQIRSVLTMLDPQLRHTLVIGGVGYGVQTGDLQRGVDVVVGCPGRLIDLIGQGILRLNDARYLVLDEADEMLDQGFARDVERIMTHMPARGDRQTVLASATMPNWVQTMITKHLENPARIAVASSAEPDLEHGLLEVDHTRKVEMLSRVLDLHRCSTIVFHRTKHGAKKLARDLGRIGHPAGELQGNLSQNARDRAIGAFRSGETTVLVATNVAARGLDISEVGLVVNYELPDTPEWLTHRVGRTARNGAAGRALTLISAEDSEQWRKLRRLGAAPVAFVDQARMLDTAEFVLTPGTPGFLNGPAAGGRGPLSQRSGAARGQPGRTHAAPPRSNQLPRASQRVSETGSPVAPPRRSRRRRRSAVGAPPRTT
ncbi:MAG: DEAD/DEAH box helicase [Candidatus Dormibacteria bacterium]